MPIRHFLQLKTNGDRRPATALSLAMFATPSAIDTAGKFFTLKMGNVNGHGFGLTWDDCDPPSLL